MSQSLKSLKEFHTERSHNLLPIQEFYKGSSHNSNDWGIDGYNLPKTYQYFDKNPKFSKAKRSDPLQEATKRSWGPDSTKYSPDLKTAFKMNWLSRTGKFPKSKKFTIIDEAIKEGKKYPGPGDYFNNQLQKTKKKTKIR